MPPRRSAEESTLSTLLNTPFFFSGTVFSAAVTSIAQISSETIFSPDSVLSPQYAQKTESSSINLQQ